MGLIELHPDLRETNRLLNRLNILFETYLWRVHGVRVLEKDNGESDEVEVMFTSNEDMLKQELERIARDDKDDDVQ
jgi:hypothetical protein